MQSQIKTTQISEVLKQKREFELEMHRLFLQNKELALKLQQAQKDIRKLQARNSAQQDTPAVEIISTGSGQVGSGLCSLDPSRKRTS